MTRPFELLRPTCHGILQHFALSIDVSDWSASGKSVGLASPLVVLSIWIDVDDLETLRFTWVSEVNMVAIILMCFAYFGVFNDRCC